MSTGILSAPFLTSASPLILVIQDKHHEKTPKETARTDHEYSRIKGEFSLKDLAVAPSSTSYLQTLVQNEAPTFLTSLQKVKDHLSEELEWLNQQVQQKTTQLQGVEALLAEAETLDLAAEAPSTRNSEAQLLSSATATDSEPIDTVAPTQELADDSQAAPSQNDDTAAANDVDDVVSSPPTNEKQQAKRVEQSSSSKAAPASKQSTQSKKTKSLGKAKPKGKGSTRGVDLRELLQPAFQDSTFGDVVSEILEQAKQPLHIDDLIDKMYKELSDEDYKRARASLANVLSIGSAKGKWRSVGKGVYAGQAVTAS